MQHPAHVPIEVAGTVPLLEKCYPEGVKPLQLILECIEVAHPINKASDDSKPAKYQGSEQPSKKSAQGAKIPRKTTHAQQENACVKKLQLLQEA